VPALPDRNDMAGQTNHPAPQDIIITTEADTRMRSLTFALGAGKVIIPTGRSVRKNETAGLPG
jgi:hypothetical protein